MCGALGALTGTQLCLCVASAGAKRSALLGLMHVLCHGITWHRRPCQRITLQNHEEMEREVDARRMGRKWPVNGGGVFLGSHTFGAWLERREEMCCPLSIVEHLMSRSQPKLIAYQFSEGQVHTSRSSPDSFSSLLLSSSTSSRSSRRRCAVLASRPSPAMERWVTAWDIADRTQVKTGESPR